MTRSVIYQPILHTLYYTLHTEYAYCLSYRFLNNVIITTVIEMVEMIEILDGRLGKRSVEQVRYAINNLLHLVIMKYGVIPLAFSSWQYCRYSWNISSYFTLTRVISLIYVCVGLYVHRMPKYIGGIAWPKQAHGQSHFWSVKIDRWHPYYSFLLYARAALVWTKSNITSNVHLEMRNLKQT